MKALILNSGVGTRMEELTADTCKCLVEIADGVTILDAQVQSLLACGVNEFCITTGSFADKIESHLLCRYPQGSFTFINNPLYDQTNYIYSIYLAQEQLQEDILLLHGDLVFEESVLQDILAADTSVLVVDSTQPLPEKDFKAIVRDGRVSLVSVDVFSGACYAQPMYKLLKKDWLVWLGEISRFCLEGKTGVYAEEALNRVSGSMQLYPLDILGRDCFEVDNKTDLAKARQFYEKGRQQVYSGYGSCSYISGIISAAKKPMVVCDSRYAGIVEHADAVYFSGFTPNPSYEDVLAGILLFEAEGCDFIVSIGGGSAIDVAKGINILAGDSAVTVRDFARCSHLAIPTTAGTGSEATHFAVLYKDGEKLSIAHKSLVPEYVILDPGFLETLPMYHKKSTMLDALCQSIESLWAKGATPKSRGYAEESIRLIEANMDDYLSGDKDSALQILQGAYLSGKAINISKTTAAHAMSYILTTRFGIAHGHAVALCLPYVWKHLLELGNAPEGLGWDKYNEFVMVLERLAITANLMENGSRQSRKAQALVRFRATGETDLELIRYNHHLECGSSSAEELADSVNAQRLSNHPVYIPRVVLVGFYGRILGVCSGI